MYIKEYKQVLIYDIGYKSPFFSKYKPTFTTDSIELAVPSTATDMRMRENDVTLGIPKTSYRHCSTMTFVKEKQGGLIPTGLKRWPFKMLMVQQMLMHRKHV